MWYPKVEGFCRFRLTATLPAGFVAVSEADHIIQEEKAGQAIFHFDFPYAIHELEGISLVASNQFITSRNGVSSFVAGGVSSCPGTIIIHR